MRKKLEYLLFDLDNTLYSAHFGLDKEMSRLVNEYIARLLGISPEEALNLRRQRIQAAGYGTTLEWLMAEQGVSEAGAEDYFRYIHPENEADTLVPDPELAPLLASFGRPMAILTNSPIEHTHRILDKLNLNGLFTSIFDIRFNRLKGKPNPQAFYNALEAMGAKVENCLFVDDVSRYVEGYTAIGGLGLYYDELNKHPEYPGSRITKLASLKEFLP